MITSLICHLMNAITLTIGEKNIVWCCDLNVVNCIVGFVCYYIHHCFEDDHPCRWQAVLFQLKARANCFFFSQTLWIPVWVAAVTERTPHTLVSVTLPVSAMVTVVVIT